MANDATSAEIKSYSADLINPVVVENVIAKASAGGAWSNSATGPTLYTKGQYDTISLKPVGTIPSTAKINTVYYTWSLSSKPVGLSVFLCYKDQSYCSNVTKAQSGSTTVFSGKAANQPLMFVFSVSGSGSLRPVVYGKTDQVIVNYQ